MDEPRRTTAELIVECLENEGVTHVFGLPGEENIRLVAALSSWSITYVLTPTPKVSARRATASRQPRNCSLIASLGELDESFS